MHPVKVYTTLCLFCNFKKALKILENVDYPRCFIFDVVTLIFGSLKKYVQNFVKKTVLYQVSDFEKIKKRKKAQT